MLLKDEQEHNDIIFANIFLSTNLSVLFLSRQRFGSGTHYFPLLTSVWSAALQRSAGESRPRDAAGTTELWMKPGLQRGDSGRRGGKERFFIMTQRLGLSRGAGNNSRGQLLDTTQHVAMWRVRGQWSEALTFSCSASSSLAWHCSLDDLRKLFLFSSIESLCSMRLRAKTQTASAQRSQHFLPFASSNEDSLQVIISYGFWFMHLEKKENFGWCVSIRHWASHLWFWVMSSVILLFCFSMHEFCSRISFFKHSFSFEKKKKYTSF